MSVLFYFEHYFIYIFEEKRSINSMNTSNSKPNHIKMTTIGFILLITVLSSALIAGLFYGYTCSVNPGLGRLPNEGYLSSMQSINRAILNPLFFASFIGTLVLLPISTFLHYGQPLSSRFLFLLAATLIYAVFVFGITMFGNVPLNEALDKFNLTAASSEEIAAQRLKFEAAWNKLHNIRTVGSVVTLLLALLSLRETAN
jgi:uncharacterized membrane protein